MLLHVTGSRKFNTEAGKLEVLISQTVNKIATNYQQLHPYFQGPSSMVMLWILYRCYRKSELHYRGLKTLYLRLQINAGRSLNSQRTINIIQESPLLVAFSLQNHVKVEILILPIWRPPSWSSDFRLDRKVLIVVSVYWRASKTKIYFGISLLSYQHTKIYGHSVWRQAFWSSNFRLHRKLFSNTQLN
jgi:hypothetical protein